MGETLQVGGAQTRRVHLVDLGGDGRIRAAERHRRLGDEDALRLHCLRELGRYKTPKRFRFVVELPKGASGKVQRLKLLE